MAGVHLPPLRHVRRAAACVVAATLAASCGQGAATRSASPTGPTGSATIDISGTWSEVGGGTRQWTLTHVGIQAGGDATFARRDHAFLGEVSGTGYVVGLFFAGAFTFSEAYERISVASMPGMNNCAMGTDGQVALSAGRLVGTYTEFASCEGGRVGQTRRAITLQRIGGP